MPQIAPPVLPQLQRFVVKQLGVVEIDASDHYRPRLRVWLDEAYDGEIGTQMEDSRNRLYLDCTSRTCRDDKNVLRKLHAFVEVLHHHDHDRDGTYDADALVAAIDTAMWETDDTPVVFERPSGGVYTSLLMGLMKLVPPPARHIAYSFGDLRPRFKKVDYLWALPMLVGFIALVQVQIHYVPWLKYSVISGYFAFCEWLGLTGVLATVSFFVLIILWSRRGRRRPGRTQTPHTYGLLNQAALYEEQVWRENAHRWNFGQRLISCVTFGAIHMVNLFYPLATILPLSIAGGVFMFIYLRSYRRYRLEGRVHARRDATFRAAIAHRLYNRCALAAVAIVIVLVVTGETLSLMGIIGMIGALAVLTWSDRRAPER